MYINSRTGQMMANPAIRHSPVLDFYISPQSYDPGQPEQVGRVVRLTKGTTQSIEGIGFTFRDFNADRSATLRGEKTILVLTDLTITPPDGSQHDATLRYLFHLDGHPTEAQEAEVPGVAGGRMRVEAVSPNDGAVVLWLRGLSKDPAAEYQAATKESLSVDVTQKPLIVLVWAGFYVMMAGALLAFLKRSREARRAVVAETRHAGPSREHVAPTGPAIPAHIRSRI